jgi:serine/threonine protein kinase
VGHSFPVDLWALGVMLYELVTGVHPFSVSGEVATYSKIATYGTKQFPQLPFGEENSPGTSNGNSHATPVSPVNPKAKALINKLVVPTPEARLGVSAGGFSALKKHGLFENIDWFAIAAPYGTGFNGGGSGYTSPLQPMASAASEDLIREGVSGALLATFSEPFTSQSGWDASLKL